MQRKLTVILSADVVGYSALMERDDDASLDELRDYPRFKAMIAAAEARLTQSPN